MLCYGLAMLSFVSGIVILLQQVVNWLQSESWRGMSLLRLLYDLDLLSTTWYVYPASTRIVHDLLDWMPATAALILVAPLLWSAGLRLAR